MSEQSLVVGVYVEPSLPKRWYCASGDEMCENVRDQRTATKSEGIASYLVSGIVVPHLRKILFEDLLVEGRLAHVYDLRWLTMLAVCECRAT